MFRAKARIRKADLRAALVAAGIGVFVSSGAVAGTVVDEWDFGLYSGFTEFTSSAGSHPVMGSNSNMFLESGPHNGPSVGCMAVDVDCIVGFIPHYASAPSKLSWGEPNNTGDLNTDLQQSSIEVGHSNGLFDSSSPGYTSIKTDLGEVPTVKVFHDNNQITKDSGYLATATLTDVLTLLPKAPSGNAFFAPQIAFSITFTETTNSSPCADDESPMPCNDIFVIDVEGAGFNPSNNTLVQKFQYDTGDGAEWYEAVLRLDGLMELEPEECMAAQADEDCVGLTTIENTLNEFQAYLAINHLLVPEPGTLAVLGLGLIGLGCARRRHSA